MIFVYAFACSARCFRAGGFDATQPGTQAEREKLMGAYEAMELERDRCVHYRWSFWISQFIHTTNRWRWITVVKTTIHQSAAGTTPMMSVQNINCTRWDNARQTCWYYTNIGGVGGDGFTANTRITFKPRINSIFWYHSLTLIVASSWFHILMFCYRSLTDMQCWQCIFATRGYAIYSLCFVIWFDLRHRSWKRQYESISQKYDSISQKYDAMCQERDYYKRMCVPSKLSVCFLVVV